MIPTIVEKQILNSLKTNMLKKQQTDENLPPPHRRPPFFFFFFLQTVTHAQKALTARGPQIVSKLRYRKLVSCDRKVLSCDRKLVSCDRKLVSCDGKIDVSLMSHRNCHCCTWSYP